MCVCLSNGLHLHFLTLYFRLFIWFQEQSYPVMICEMITHLYDESSRNGCCAILLFLSFTGFFSHRQFGLTVLWTSIDFIYLSPLIWFLNIQTHIKRYYYLETTGKENIYSSFFSSSKCDFTMDLVVITSTQYGWLCQKC